MDGTMPANTLYRRSIYSEELLKALYIDPGPSFNEEQDSSVSATEKDTLYDQRNGVRCNQISPISKHLLLACFLLPPVLCLLPPASCLLLPASCLLPSAFCVRPPASCLPLPASRLLPPTSCLLLSAS